MVKEKTEVSYVHCPDQSCGSRKQRILLIEYDKNKSILSLLCMECGSISSLSFPGIDLPELKPLEKKDLTYLG